MEIINENVNFKIDASGRIVVPAQLRKKFGMNPGDRVEYYTVFEDGKWYIAFAKI